MTLQRRYDKTTSTDISDAAEKESAAESGWRNKAAVEEGALVEEMEQIAFVVDSRDNVATALCKLEPGQVRLSGEAVGPTIEISQEIPDGHKFALVSIGKGERIVKYGIVIGQATQDIPAGTWVHLHCIKSLVDERSSHLDIHTGVPNDIEY